MTRADARDARRGTRDARRDARRRVRSALATCGAIGLACAGASAVLRLNTNVLNARLRETASGSGARDVAPVGGARVMSVREVSMGGRGGGRWRTTREKGWMGGARADDLDARFEAFMRETDEYDEGEGTVDVDAVRARAVEGVRGGGADDETAWAEMLAAEGAARGDAGDAGGTR